MGRPRKPLASSAGNRKRYVSLSADCRCCSRRSNCPTEFRKKAPNKRYVRRSLDQDLFEEVQARMEESEFRKRLSERMWKAEGLFAEVKQNHGLSWARYRGRAKVQIQAYLIAVAQNLKRLVFLFCCWLIALWSHKLRRLSPFWAGSVWSRSSSTGPAHN
jgi:hypothetical protein